MSNIANKIIVLTLNSAWKPAGFVSVKKAIINLTGDEFNEDPSNFALDIEYETDENGDPVFDKIIKMNPVTWSDWIKLPIRKWDLTINSAINTYRVPTVIVAANFKKMPKKLVKKIPSKEDILRRDNYTCQVTGKELPRHELNVDHVVPLSRGGTNTWENMVACSKTINNAKGNKLNSELGIKLIRQPFKPKEMDMQFAINAARNKDHEHFLMK